MGDAPAIVPFKPQPRAVALQERQQNMLFNPSQMAGPGHSPKNDGDITIRDVLILFRQWKVILGCFIGGLLLGVVYLLITPKQYRSTAILEVATYSPKLHGTAREDELAKKTAEENYFATQVQGLTGLTLADAVMQRKEIIDYFNKIPGYQELLEKESLIGSSYVYSADKLKEYYDRLVKVKPIRDTALIEVSVTSLDPELSANLANIHAKEFIAEKNRTRAGSDNKDIGFLKKQAAELKKQLADAEKKLSEFAKENAMTALEGEAEIAVNQVKDVQTQVSEARAARINAENAYKSALEDVSNANGNSTFVDDESTKPLREALAAARVKYTSLGERFVDTYPAMKELKMKISSLEEQITKSRTRALNSLKVKLDSARAIEKEITQAGQADREGALTTARSHVEFQRMKHEYELLRQLRERAVQEIQELRFSSGVSVNNNIALTQPAAIVKKPASPRVLLSVGLGGAGGLALGLLVALILLNLDQKVRTPEELEEALPEVPALGIIPHFITDELDATLQAMVNVAQNSQHDAATDNAKEQHGDQASMHLPQVARLPLTLLRNPYSLASEGFRIIRSAIQLSSPDHPYQVVHVVSASEGEGKSCVSAHLAAALAMAGKRTLLVDADLRRPSIHNYYRYKSDAAGLSEVLTGQVELESVTHEIPEVEGLTVLPAGGSVPNPVELLGSQKMHRLITEMRERYDMIVIDSPPVAAMADALVLTGIADGSLFVVRSATSPRQHLQNSVKRLVGSGGRIIGTVLNDYAVKGNGYYGAYGHGVYKERGDEVRRKAA